jgi:proteasome alpha subunit
MLTPYDWQEGIGHRAQYVENKLSQGSPVLALSVSEGIVIFTYRRSARKIYEIYDRLAFAAVGQQSDIEALRVAAVDFAHQEGFNRSEQDVTLQRVVTALSAPVKKAFADFSSAPFVIRALFAEVGPTIEQDALAVLDYDGDFVTRKGFAVVGTSEEQFKGLQTKVGELSADLTATKAEKALKELWQGAREEGHDFEDLTPEIVLLERSDLRENRFKAFEGH